MFRLVCLLVSVLCFVLVGTAVVSLFEVSLCLLLVGVCVYGY